MPSLPVHHLSHRPVLRIIPMLCFLLFACGGAKESPEEALQTFINAHVAELKPLQQHQQRAAFQAAITGHTSDYEKSARYRILITELYSDAKAYAQLKKWQASGAIEDSLLQRQLDILLKEYQFHQLDADHMADMVRASSALEKKFSTYQPEWQGKPVNYETITQVLQTSTDTKELKAAWEASKQVGPLVATDLKKLVRTRNEAAQELGFANYHDMRLRLSGQDPQVIASIYEDLDLITARPYAELKYAVDDYLSEKLDLPESELRPWHYEDPFFQSAPGLYNMRYNPLYADKDLVHMAKTFYQGLGLPIDNILANSDLKPRLGKIPLATTFPVAHEDVRIVASLTDDMASMHTLLYESGFSLYHSFINADLPYLLRQPSHFLANDAVATLFSRFAFNPECLAAIAGIKETKLETIATHYDKYLRLEKFIFARWAMVMYHFEKGLYENPDRDLTTFWWDLVEKYQLIRRPDNRTAPDWATKAHLITMPCTYHNYMLGELFASQLQYYIKTNILQVPENECVSCINEQAVGKYLKKRVFAPGASLTWRQLIEYATNEPLEPDHFKAQYIQ